MPDPEVSEALESVESPATTIENEPSPEPAMLGKRRLSDFARHPLHLAIYRRAPRAVIEKLLETRGVGVNSECFLPPYRHGIAAYEEVANASPVPSTDSGAEPRKYMFSPLALILVVPRLVRSIEEALPREPSPPKGWQEFLDIWREPGPESDSTAVASCPPTYWRWCLGARGVG